MNLNTFKEMDLFGQDLKWRLLNKDNFKSSFGGFVTMIVSVIFAVKVYFFVKKVNEFGFAKSKVSSLFRNEYQFLNMTDFRLALYTQDLDSAIKNYEEENGVRINNRSYFNLSDFIQLDINLKSFNINGTSTLIIEEKGCANDKNFEFLGKEVSIEKLAPYKCLGVREDFNYINITKNQTLYRRPDGENTNIQLDTIKVFEISFKMKPWLISFLTENDISFNVYLVYFNYRVNPDNYELGEYSSQLKLTIDPSSAIEGSVSFRKLSVTKKLEFDIVDSELSDLHKYEIEQSSLRINKNPRSSKKMDKLKFYLDIFEVNNEITLYTFDDIMATLGGFLQVFLILAEIIVASYNQDLTQRVLSHFCMEKFVNYEKTLGHVRRNIYTQMDYYSKTKKGPRPLKESEKDKKPNNKNETNIETEGDHFRKQPKSLLFAKNANKPTYLGKNEIDEGVNEEKLFNKNQEQMKEIDIKENFDNSNYQKINPDYDRNRFEEPKLNTEPNAVYLQQSVKTEEKKYAKKISQQEYNTEEFPIKEINSDEEIKGKQEDELNENDVKIELKQMNGDADEKMSNGTKNNIYESRILPKSKKRLNYFETDFDFMEFMSIERYLSLLSGFEAFKFYYFNDMNRFNFDCLSDLFVFSRNYNLKLKDRRFFLSEKTIPTDLKQKKLFDRMLKYLKEY